MQSYFKLPRAILRALPAGRSDYSAALVLCRIMYFCSIARGHHSFIHTTRRKGKTGHVNVPAGWTAMTENEIRLHLNLPSRTVRSAIARIVDRKLVGYVISRFNGKKCHKFWLKLPPGFHQEGEESVYVYTWTLRALNGDVMGAFVLSRLWYLLHTQEGRKFHMWQRFPVSPPKDTSLRVRVGELADWLQLSERCVRNILTRLKRCRWIAAQHGGDSLIIQLPYSRCVAADHGHPLMMLQRKK